MTIPIFQFNPKTSWRFGNEGQAITTFWYEIYLYEEGKDNRLIGDLKKVSRLQPQQFVDPEGIPIWAFYHPDREGEKDTQIYYSTCEDKEEAMLEIFWKLL